MKAWFSKYFNLVFAIYLTACAVWFAYESNWSAVVGYTCAAMAWGLLWSVEQLHKKTLAEVERMYEASLEEEFKRYVERANNAS